MDWRLIKRLSFKRRLIIAAHVARLLLVSGIGGMHELQWFCLMESWLAAMGVQLTEIATQEKERAA